MDFIPQESKSTGKRQGSRFDTRSDSPFSSRIVVYGHCLVTLSGTMSKTFKWLTTLPFLIPKSFCWWQCCVRYKLPLPSYLLGFRSPSFITKVAQDVKLIELTNKKVKSSIFLALASNRLPRGKGFTFGIVRWSKVVNEMFLDPFPQSGNKKRGQSAPSENNNNN